MKKGENRTTNLLLRLIGSELKEEIDNFTNSINLNYFYKFTNQQQIANVFQNDINNFTSSLSEDEISNLRYYTGYYYKFINAILREKWDYESLGLLSSEKEKKYKQLADNINKIIKKTPPNEIDFYTYRGVTIETFYDYNIQSLEDLRYMNGKYFYERGFTSTSVLEESCYFQKNIPDRKTCNIKIKYLIPENSNDGIFLNNNLLSYSPNQLEYVINSGSLFKVLDVEIKENTAILTMALIPKNIYDKPKKNISKH